MGIKDYSTTPASNTSLFPEGMNPAAVNNGMRQVQADIRSFYEAPEFRDLGHTPTYATSTSFKLSGDKTSQYVVGQRVKAYGTIMGTLYGTIATSAYSAPDTTITLTMDSGSLTSNLSIVYIGIDPTSAPIPAAAISGLAGATTTTSGIVELATDAEAQTGTDTARAITPANLQAVTATATRKGVVELSTDAEAQTGTDTDRALTPANLQAVTATDTRKGVVETATKAEMISQTADKYPDASLIQHNPFVAKAWARINWSGGTPSIVSSYGVSGIADNGTGLFTLTWSNTFTDANYAIIATASNYSGSNGCSISLDRTSVPTSTTARFRVTDQGTPTMVDPDFAYVVAFGDLA